MILVTRAAYYVVAALCLVYVACSNSDPMVYRTDQGGCRFSATGSEAPEALCAKLVPTPIAEAP